MTQIWLTDLIVLKKKHVRYFTCDDYFAGHENEKNHFWIVQAIYQTRKEFGFLAAKL